MCWLDLYFEGIRFIGKVKTGPFFEHSPILNDIATSVPSWEKVASGMIKMCLLQPQFFQRHNSCRGYMLALSFGLVLEHGSLTRVDWRAGMRPRSCRSFQLSSTSFLARFCEHRKGSSTEHSSCILRNGSKRGLQRRRLWKHNFIC